MAIIQDWKIRSRSQTCCHSGEPFEDGDEFYTCIFDDLESDGFIRQDYAAAIWDEVQSAFDPPPFSFWKSTFEVPPVEEKTEAIEKHSAETMLRQMIDEDDSQTENARYILAIMLERKKTLKPVETRETENRKLLFYEHKDNGDVFIIADPRLHLSEIESVQEEVTTLLKGGQKANERETEEPEPESQTGDSEDVSEAADQTDQPVDPDESPESPKSPAEISSEV